MYVTLLERLIEPILLNKTCEVEIRELVENNHYNDLILMAQKSLISVLIGKKGNTIINDF